MKLPHILLLAVIIALANAPAPTQMSVENQNQQPAKVKKTCDHPSTSRDVSIMHIELRETEKVVPKVDSTSANLPDSMPIIV